MSLRHLALKGAPLAGSINDGAKSSTSFKKTKSKKYFLLYSGSESPAAFVEKNPLSTAIKEEGVRYRQMHLKLIAGEGAAQEGGGEEDGGGGAKDGGGAGTGAEAEGAAGMVAVSTGPN